MLIRRDLQELLKEDSEYLILGHYTRSFKIRCGFKGLKLPSLEKGKVFIPSCHEVAHAYAKAFDVEVVDGEHAYVKKNSLTSVLKRRKVYVSTYMHSWNIIRINDEKSIILDIFPDQGCPMMPVLLENPHPAYWVPNDKKFKKMVIDKLKESEEFPVVVDLLVKEFLRIDAGK